MPDNNDEDIEFMQIDELNETFKDIFEMDEYDQIKLAYSCANWCGGSPSK